MPSCAWTGLTYSQPRVSVSYAAKPTTRLLISATIIVEPSRKENVPSSLREIKPRGTPARRSSLLLA